MVILPDSCISIGITSLQVQDNKSNGGEGGFEPPIPFRVCRFSRPEPSTTRPPLRNYYCFTTVVRTVRSAGECCSLVLASGIFARNGRPLHFRCDHLVILGFAPRNA